MTDQSWLAEIKALLAQPRPPGSAVDPITGRLTRDHLERLVGEVERLQRFEAMWEDCRTHRDNAERRARRYMDIVQQVAKLVVPDEDDPL